MEGFEEGFEKGKKRGAEKVARRERGRVLQQTTVSGNTVFELERGWSGVCGCTTHTTVGTGYNEPLTDITLPLAHIASARAAESARSRSGNDAV
jgi:hypothetical protein